MLEKVKLALRISHTKLDNDILATIETAKAELIRLGCLSNVVIDETDPLIAMAIKTYCLYIYCDTDKADHYFQSFQYQADCLRKSIGYRSGDYVQ